MADIASAKSKMNDVEINADAPLSEALHEKLGANINYLIDTTDDHETRLDSLETVVDEKSALISGTTSSTSETTLGSRTITPPTTSVLVILELDGTGSKDISVDSGAGTIRIKRGATTIYSATISNSTPLIRQPIVYLDTGATADASNTYSVTAQVSAGSVIMTYDFIIAVVGLK